MDKDTRNRNRLQGATQAARTLLERELAEQLEGTFDVRLDGTIDVEPGGHLDSTQRVVRAKLVATVEHLRSNGLSPAQAVAAYLREVAFTTLNRFVALKLLEARGLVSECVTRGDESSGFKEFIGLAPGLARLPDHGYRLYIESIFDEIGREVGSLFDRRDTASLLRPRRPALQELLRVLNDPDLAGVWGEDETIGWIYQHFISDEDRQRARYDEKGRAKAPQNSHELAVRNQFFTPRYLVGFLTDNTLGRIWYEMCEGKTRLADHCDYLVRRPSEFFLGEGEEALRTDPGESSTLGHDESVRNEVYVAFRAKKDPRDLKILDPACGSGHFLLYAFDLLIGIYQEAWQDETGPASELTDRSLREDYANFWDLSRAIPGLVLKHNLYGIEIDARASQIAALALWLRAQRAFSEFDIARAERPAITKTNLVVAEPMPGERQLREEFITALDQQLGQLVRRIFDRMELAGELGSLLRIEDEIPLAIRDIYGQTGQLFRESDEERWRSAEQQLLQALRDYGRKAEQSGSYGRRLFAEDAARGYSFIDICRLRFDVVLMNPPFGDVSAEGEEYISARYPFWSHNVLCAFAERGVSWAGAADGDGLVGSVCDRTVNVKSTYEAFRREVLLGGTTIAQALDLGWGVLDANVEVAAWTLAASKSSRELNGFDLRESKDKPAALSAAIGRPTTKTIEEMRSLPNAVIGYFFPGFVTRAFAANPSLTDCGFDLFEGHTLKSERYFRFFWELPSGTQLGIDTDWTRLFNGTPYSRFYFPLCEVAPYGKGARIVAADDGSVLRNLNKHHLAGVCFGKRGEFVDAQVLPNGFVSTVEGKACSEPNERRAYSLLAVLNSDLFQYMINLYCGQHKYSGYVGLFPYAGEERLGPAAEAAKTVAELKARCYRFAEFSPFFEGYAEYVGNPQLLIYRLQDWASHISLAEQQAQRAVFDAYDLSTSEIQQVLDFCIRRPQEDVPSMVLGSQTGAPFDPRTCVMHWLLGVAFGRNASLPTYGAQDQAVAAYPSCTPPPPIDRGGGRAILVDDRGHEDDLVAAMFQAYNKYARSADKPTQSLPGTDWLRTACFEQHVRVFSVGRRAAPIYWQLATPSASYSVWLYYHQLTRDSFYKASKLVASKLEHEDDKLRDLINDAGGSATAGQAKEIAPQAAFVDELRAFRDEVVRIAPLWNPDLNDGVLVNFAPLWRLVPQHRVWQKECKDCWDKLVAGDYDWAHLAMHLWPERVVPKCATDRSLAIAHGLEDVFWLEGPNGKWERCDVDQATVDALVKERSSPAVKDALKSLMEAPQTSSSPRTRSRRAVASA